MRARDRVLVLLIVLASAATLAGGVAAGSSRADAHVLAATPAMRTTTGPVPPPNVTAPQSTSSRRAIQGEDVIAGVPAYLWRDGCGPTSLGMIVGYYDGHGFDALIPGDASTQTTEALQAIASHQVAGGGPRHYEDYSQPIDSGGNVLADRSGPPAGDEHADDCIADFMHTSRSAEGLAYGYSWTNAVGPAFRDYVHARIPGATVTTTDLYWGSTLTWSAYTQEIDAGRPMVLLVDSSGDGQIDHAVAAIGYRLADGVQEYACWDTWYTPIRWTPFRGVSSSYAFGVWGATELSISVPSPGPSPSASPSPSSSPSPTSSPSSTPSPSPSPDTTPPVTQVSGVDAAWHALPVALTFAATDLESGVARTETRLDGAASWVPGTSLHVSNQGSHTVAYRSVDVAGNVETARSCTVRVDAVGPRVFAAPTTVTRGRTATIAYRAYDLTPRVTVRLVLTRQGGTWRKAFGPVLRSAGARHTFRFVCTLPRGVYTISVRATDLAGNVQSRQGVARLVVR